MGIARFDDDTPLNRKVRSAGASASWLWFCGILYCRKALTDGFIERQMVPTLFVGMPKPFKYAAKLVEVGLWHEQADGYTVHDYLEWNPTKTAVEEYRKIDRERKQAKHKIQPEGSNGFRPESNRIPNDPANARGTHAGAKSESEIEIEGLGSGSSEESARETIAAIEPARQTRTFTRHHGLLGSHASCFYMPAACAAGMCIPPWLGQQWTAQYRGDLAAAEVEIKAFVGARLHGLEIGQDPAKYWKAAWTAHHGAVVPSPPHSDRATRTMNAAEAVIARQMAAQKALK